MVSPPYLGPYLRGRAGQEVREVVRRLCPGTAVDHTARLPSVWAQQPGWNSISTYQLSGWQEVTQPVEDSFVQEFLSKDPCFQISDKYLLAMVLVYFQRAHLKLSEYTHSSLFLALYLANDMEEDLEGPKCEIFPWALGKDWCLRVGKFLHQRDELWARMGFRAVVSRQCCEEVMAKEPFHWAWTRDRRPHHGGVQRVCPQGPVCLPRGPGLSPPHCSPCGLPQHCSSHLLKPVSSKCPSLTSECHCPPSQNYLSRIKNAWGGDFLIVLPPQMQLEPGTYSLRIFPKPPARPGH
ncbi:speedy protein C isoform X2 [Pongo abelii]|uniref:speedy protein C isoform X2 n=1 Tax=Pongo abelii TaxID=9601 RepID=UPI003005B6A4